MTVQSRGCQQHEMSVRTLAVLCLGMVMAVVGVAGASRLPLVVFQHHHTHHHHIYDEQDVQQVQEESNAPASDNHHFPHFKNFDEGRGMRVLYQVGVSTVDTVSQYITTVKFCTSEMGSCKYAPIRFAMCVHM